MFYLARPDTFDLNSVSVTLMNSIIYYSFNKSWQQQRINLKSNVTNCCQHFFANWSGPVETNQIQTIKKKRINWSIEQVYRSIGRFILKGHYGFVFHCQMTPRLEYSRAFWSVLIPPCAGSCSWDDLTAIMRCGQIVNERSNSIWVFTNAHLNPSTHTNASKQADSECGRKKH